MGLSGSYKAGGWFGGYSDDLTLRSSRWTFLRLLPREKLPTGGPCFSLRAGPYEERFLAETRELAAALAARQVPHTLEMWGADSAHDWPWWQKQLPIFVGRALAALGANLLFFPRRACAACFLCVSANLRRPDTLFSGVLENFAKGLALLLCHLIILLC